MPIYNCEGTLKEAVDSIRQQSFRDFELLLWDDGSSDGTLSLAQKIATADNRIVVLSNETNMGLNISLNRCLRHARGEFYARMDGDDTCAPDRLEKLVKFMDENPGFALVSSWIRMFDDTGFWGEARTIPFPDRRNFLRGSPFVHGPCMMRTAVLRELGGYGTSPRLKRGQDLDLWFRMYAKGHKGANIQEHLYHVRDDKNAFLRRTLRSRVSDSITLLKGFRMLGFPIWLWPAALRPMIVGLIPKPIYGYLRRRKLARVGS